MAAQLLTLGRAAGCAAHKLPMRKALGLSRAGAHWAAT